MEELTSFFSSLRFASPLYFWLGGAIIIFLIFFPALKTKRNLRWDRGYWIKKVPELKSKKPLALFVLLGVTSLLIAVAIANPQIAEKKSIPIHGKPVMILIDISGSISPGLESSFSFQATEKVYYDIIKRDMGATIGLSFYSDESYIARDFAEKPAFLKDTIENKQELQEISGGTMTDRALFNARRYFSEKVRAKDKAIVLISDLLDNPDPMGREMKQVLKEGINLYVVAVAEDSATADRYTNDLRRIIGSNDVKMVWHNDAQGINGIYEEISRMESSVIGETEILSQRSLRPYFLPAILGSLVLSIMLSETIFRKIP